MAGLANCFASGVSGRATDESPRILLLRWVSMAITCGARAEHGSEDAAAATVERHGLRRVHLGPHSGVVRREEADDVGQRRIKKLRELGVLA